MNNLKSILLLAKSNLILQNKLTLFGVFWSFLSPLLFMFIYSFAFKGIFRTQVDNYPLFVISTLLAWMFFSSCVGDTSNTIVNNRNILINMPINISKFIFSSVLANYFTFAIHQVTFLIILAYLFNYISLYSVFCLVVLNIVFLIFVTNISIVISIIKVYFKNISYIIDMCFTALIFMSPVFYSKQMLPKEFEILSDINPLFIFFENFRKIFYDGKASLDIELFYCFLINFVVLFILLRFLNNAKSKLLEII